MDVIYPLANSIVMLSLAGVCVLMVVLVMGYIGWAIWKETSWAKKYKAKERVRFLRGFVPAQPDPSNPTLAELLLSATKPGPYATDAWGRVTGPALEPRLLVNADVTAQNTALMVVAKLQLLSQHPNSRGVFVDRFPLWKTNHHQMLAAMRFFDPALDDILEGAEKK